jgi:intein/homing endonuclease
MWSLYKRTTNPDSVNPFDTDGEELKPLEFSNNKTQADVVKEILDAIEKGNKLIFIKGVCGTGKCLSKNTLIFCKPYNEKYFSYHAIKSLTGKHGKISTLNNNGKITESNFNNVRKTGTKKLYKLKTRTGREIITSKNHPFLTITKNGKEWQPLEKLTEKSYICLPNIINLNQEIESNENEIKILAHLIAEGKLTDKTGSPKYYQCQTTNPLVRKDYEEALSSLFPDGKIKSRNYEVTIVFNNMDTTKGTTNKLRLFIRKHGLDKKSSNEKFVPTFIFNSKKEKISTFLKTLFSCDGSIYQKTSHKGKAKQTIIEYCSISKRLINDISILLNIFGIQHTITSKKFRENPEYVWRITISSQPQIKKFIENIGFIGRKMKFSLKLLPSLNNHKFTNTDKVPRLIRGYLKSKKYSYNQLNRYLNYKEIEKIRAIKGFKQIKKDKNILTPSVFTQSKIDFLRTHIKKINGYIKDKELNFICSEDIFWDKIKSIEYINEDETYDLEVEKYHNFIANGIIVHNSAIALNLARHFKKTSIVVPIKSLQEQYENDYTKDKFILKKNKKPLDIAIIKGRMNFRCPFNGEKANSPELPCTIEIREKNTAKLLEYIDKNPAVEKEDFSTASDIRRMNIAPACPYWAPLIPADIKPKGLDDVKKIKYDATCGKEFALFQRKKGCQYYDQCEAYAKADVLVFNAMKYQIETMLGRKPKTDLDIIDECDEFLDSFAKLHSSLSNLTPQEKEDRTIIKKLIHKINDILYEKEIEIQKIKQSPMLDIIELAIENPNLAEDEELNYYNTLVEIARSFENLLDETYISMDKIDKDKSQTSLFSKKEDTVIVNIVSINLAQKLKELIEQNNVLVMMSGTLHSEQVLKDIFGLDEFKIIEAETQNPGQINKQRTGLEKNCAFRSFKDGIITRNQYLKILDMCMAKSEQPTLVHISAFKDLPSEQENQTLMLDNLITQERLKDLQSKGNTAVDDFTSGETDILFTTKCARGVDFPGDKCNSIVITRFPYPNIQGLFWKILKQEQPEKFMEFYLDKARRDLIQKIARGVRFKGDKVNLYSPDIRVLNSNLN